MLLSLNNSLNTYTMIIMIVLWLVYLLIVAVILVLIMAVMKPNTFQYKRSASINAAPEKIFSLLNDFHQWTQWSPWEKLDMGMKKMYTGAATGVGAKYEWLSENKKVGNGKMEIVEAVPGKSLKIQIDFIKPFEAHNMIDFTLQTHGATTKITWMMTGSNPLMSKIMSVVINMEKLIGKDFETGLASLKQLAENH